MTVDPAKAGTNSIHIYITTPAGALDPASSVTVTITNTDRDVGPLPVPVEPAGPNHVTTSDMQIPFSGNWRLEIDALFGQFDQSTFTTTFHAS